jgi:hypothetical protein
MSAVFIASLTGMTFAGGIVAPMLPSRIIDGLHDNLLFCLVSGSNRAVPLAGVVLWPEKSFPIRRLLVPAQRRLAAGIHDGFINGERGR